MNTVTYPITNRELLNIRRKIRRQSMIRKRVVLMILAVFLTLLFTFSYNVLVTQANEEVPDAHYKYFTYHEVEKGETLWSIAEANINYDFYDSVQDYVSEVMEMNHMTNDVIRVGESIVITYYSDMYY